MGHTARNSVKPYEAIGPTLLPGTFLAHLLGPWRQSPVCSKSKGTRRWVPLGQNDKKSASKESPTPWEVTKTKLFLWTIWYMGLCMRCAGMQWNMIFQKGDFMLQAVLLKCEFSSCTCAIQLSQSCHAKHNPQLWSFSTLKLKNTHHYHGL